MTTTDGHGGQQGGATLEAVARVAGVSRATVSRVVNDSPRVSPDVRAAVESAIRQLGYTPNRAARSLVTRRSDSIAVVITEPTGRLFSDPFFPRLVRGVSAALAARDLQLVLLMPEPAEEARTIRYLTGGHVDGVLLASLHGDDPIPSALAARGVPLVFVGRPPVTDISHVDVDNHHGGRRATAHLLEQGARRVATIAGPQDMTAGVDRLEGYRAGIRATGAEPEDARIAFGDFTFEGGAAAMERLLASAPDLDGVVAASDLMAAGALAVLEQHGRRVPEDVIVVGYDDSPIAATTRPPLTSVRQPIEEMGREAVHLLLDAIERPDRPPRRVVLATELVMRASSTGRTTG